MRTKRFLTFYLALAMLLSIMLVGCGAVPSQEESIPEGNSGEVVEDNSSALDNSENKNDVSEDLNSDSGGDATDDSSNESNDVITIREPEIPAVDEDATYFSGAGDHPESEMIEHTLDDFLFISGEDGVSEDNDFNASSSMVNNRAWYNLGTCTTLDGNTQIIVLFLNDNESHWDDVSISEFFNRSLYPGLQFIADKAVFYQVDLTFNTAYYSSDPAQNFYLNYNGTVGNNIETSYSPDILTQAAYAIGFRSVDEMYEYSCQWAGVEKVAFMVAMNKYGRSYALPDQQNDNYDYIEYCVIFNSPMNAGPYGLISATVAHEMLHLYGAEDYYLETSTRKDVADLICYYDIMRRVYTDISYNHIGGYTAYSVGWKNAIPPEYNRPDWFT